MNEVERDLKELSPEELEFYDNLSDVLMVLSDVASGDYAARIEIEFPENHPFGALARGLNETFGVLQAAHDRSQRYQKELEEKLAMIERQREAIRELSTPIMEVWESIVCLPVVGVLDTARSADMTDSLLNAVVNKKARFVIIDITGIEAMDTRTADHFIRMARAVGLLGAKCVLSGINPSIAQTLVHLGVSIEDLVSYRSLRDALQACVSKGKRALR